METIWLEFSCIYHARNAVNTTKHNNIPAFENKGTNLNKFARIKIITNLVLIFVCLLVVLLLVPTSFLLDSASVIPLEKFSTTISTYFASACILARHLSPTRILLALESGMPLKFLMKNR